MKIVELEIPATVVPAGFRENVLVRPGGSPFSPYSLLLDDESAQHFLIIDFCCGRDSYQISRGAFPASVFSEKAMMEEIYFGSVLADPDPGRAYTLLDVNRDPGLVDCGFNLWVVNTSREAQTFRGKVLGWSEMCRPLDRFRTVVGLGSTRVPGGQACNVAVMPQFDFAPDRLVVPRAIGASFVVDMVRIFEFGTGDLRGNTAGGELGSAYSERLEGRISLTGVRQTRPGDVLSVSVRNVGDEPADFCGAFFGTAQAM